MIEVLDTEAARMLLARGKLGCPACGQMMRPWGHARERTVRDLGETLITVRPDRALCRGCGITHVLLDARLLPRRGYAVALIGKALPGAAFGVRAPARRPPAGRPGRHRAGLDPRCPLLGRPAAHRGHPHHRAA